MREKYFETVHVRTDVGDHDTAYLFDAILESGSDGVTPGTDFAKITWLYNFEQLYSQDDEPVEEAVDEVLRVLW